MANNPRRVVVFSNANGKNTVLPACTFTYWKELKAELGDLVTSNVEAVVKGTKATLQLDDALLPPTDFTVFLVAKNMKSGGLFTPKQDALTELSDEQLAKVATHFGLKSEGTGREIRKRLRAKQVTLNKEFTTDEINEILGIKSKNVADVVADIANSKTSEEVEVGVGKALDEAQEEIIEALSEDEITLEEAEDALKNIMGEAKEKIVKIIGSVKVQTVKQGVDLMEGLEDEWKEIQAEIKRK